MVPYCAQKLFWGEFIGKKEIQLKVNQMNWKQIGLNWNPFLSIVFFEVEKRNQFKVESNELKVTWFQLKSFLINRFLWDLKGKTIEIRFKWIESKLISIEILSYQ